MDGIVPLKQNMYSLWKNQTVYESPVQVKKSIFQIVRDLKRMQFKDSMILPVPTVAISDFPSW
jgi:hypothetical protein